MNVKKRISHAILALILMLGFVIYAMPVWAGSTSSAWNPFSPPPMANTLNGVTHGNGIYVAVGSSGIILTSVNGTDNWQSHDSGTANLNGVACGVDSDGNNLFAAVGNDGTILTSSDGTAWDVRSSTTTEAVYGVTYGGGQFVAVGSGGTILTSPDGETWEAMTDGSGNPYTSENLYSATYGLDSYGNDILVVAGSNGIILSFLSLSDWSYNSSYSAPSNVCLYGLTFGWDSNGDALFAATGENGAILTSSDGETWSSQTSGVSETLNGISYGGGQFVAVGDSGTILASDGGAAWTPQTSGTSNSLCGVACGNNYYVAVGQAGTMLYYQVKPAAGAATITSVRDIGSNGNGSDLEVSFDKAADESLVSEYRIMVVPVSEAANFNVIKANLISVDYTTVNKTGTNLKVTLSATATDIDGYSLENDSTYKVFILSMADGVNATANTLSGASSEITLRMWNWANPKPNGNTFNGTAYGNNLYVAVGDSSAIFTSPDGADWTNCTSETDYDLYGVTYGKGIFVAVGDRGSAVTSLDGIHWTHNDNASNILDPGAGIKGVAYGKGLFVAVCSDGNILTSPDGVTWISRMSNAYLNAITYAAGYFVGVGDNGKIMTSPDGKVWTSVTNSGTPYTSENLYGITYGGSGYVAVGTNGKIMTSSDGINWSSTTASFEYMGTTYPVDSDIMAVTYGSGRYLSITSGIILTSSDGTTWSANLSGPTANIYGLVYGNGLFVAVGDAGIMTLPSDGASWTRQSSGILNYIRGVIYVGSRFIAVGNGSILVSNDGAAWVSQSVDEDYDLRKVAYGKDSANQDIYVAVGSNGYPNGDQGIIVTSTDGVTWSLVNTRSDSNTPLAAVAYGNGTFVAVGRNNQSSGDYGVILTSTDGSNWSSQGDGSSTWSRLYGVAYGNGIFVAIGYKGIILTSSDGTNWTIQPASGSSASDTLNGISYVNNTFVAVGYGGRIIYSTDGVTWNTLTDSRTSANLYGVTYNNGLYVAVGESGTVRISDNLPPFSVSEWWNWTWNGCDPGTKNVFYGVCWGNGVYVAVGADGTILTSGTANTATPTTANASNNSVSVNPSSITAGSSTTITAAGDQQSVAGSVYGDERYIPTIWESTELGKNGTFTLSGSDYTSSYTPSSSGSYTITATFQKQTWDGSVWNDATGSTDTKTVSLTVTDASVPTTANPSNNTVSMNPPSITRGNSTIITAAGDRQSVAGAVYGDERYIPTVWTSTEAGKNGTFALSGGNFTSNYTSSSAGSYTITATFQKQTWDGSAWNDVANSMDTKTASLMVTEASAPTMANASNNTVSVNPASITRGTSTTITATGDRQSVTGTVYGDERYIPTAWISTEKDKNGTFTLLGSTYTSSYTPSSAGSYTITATFQKQTWDGNAWNDMAGSTDTKTVSLIVNSSGGGGGSSGTGGSATTETSQSGLGSVTTENGTATATLDPAKLAKEISASGFNSVIVFAITGNADKAAFNLTVADLKAIADNGSMLQLESPLGIYKLPAAEIDFDGISKQYPNISYKDIKVTIAFSKANGTKAKLDGSRLVGQPVSITVSLTAGDKVIELDEFTKYVERDLPVPDGSGFTTGVVIEKDGTLRHVPTKTVTINGKKYAAIFSRTNSIYGLIDKTVSFDDMEGHWAKEAVNDMASRLIISGVGNNTFAPGRDITRAEFAAIVVRALGLKTTGSVNFTDVKSGSWYYGAVAAAYKYGIVSGYGDGTFKPDNRITRQEAMLMTARAMKAAGMDTAITGETAAAEMAKFIDGGSFSGWAKQDAAAVIRSGLVVGSEGYARPERNITRAETAVIIKRLLEKAGLI